MTDESSNPRPSPLELARGRATGVWPCEAYGADGLAFGALCFHAEPGERACASPAICHARMTISRAQTFDRIHELAAAGEPTFQYLAGEFSSPDELLGGAGDSVDDGAPPATGFHRSASAGHPDDERERGRE